MQVNNGEPTGVMVNIYLFVIIILFYLLSYFEIVFPGTSFEFSAWSCRSFGYFAFLW